MTALHRGKPICGSPLRRDVALNIFPALYRQLFHTSEQLAIGLIFLVLSTAAPLLGAPLATQETPGNFVITGSLVNARLGHTATLLPNGKVLVAGGEAGGYYGNSSLASAELFDPASGAWSLTGSLATARRYHTATLLPNGKVLVAGGYSVNGVLASAELYDPASGTWSATGSLGTARVDHTATLLPNGKVLVAGLPESAELYDPASGTWSATGSLGTARTGHTATLLPNGKVLVAGGRGSSVEGALASAELYDPASGTWSATGSLATERHSHTATLLPNGKVLVAGGGYLAQALGHVFRFLASAELYDPASGTWSATTGSPTISGFGHTATLLPNGKVLVPSALYDPASGTWSATGSLVFARIDHTATLLPNGKVLVAGGYSPSIGGIFGILASAELYDTPVPMPAVTVSVSATNVIQGADATFTISASTMNPSDVTTVHYSMGGKAKAGTNYTLSGVSGEAEIPAGASSTTVTLHALAGPMKGNGKTAILKLMPATSYTLASPSKASVTILNGP